MSAARLAWLRRRARLVLTIEAISVAALWPTGVIVLFLIVCLLGFGGWQADLLGLVVLGFAIHHARRSYQPPTPAAIDRRIERDSRLPHRPIAALEDYPALVGTGAALLWQAHRTRLERTISGARVAGPAPDFAAHDPFALRALLLLVLIAAWIAAGPDAGNRLAASLRMPSLFSTAGIGVQAWITPPRWAGSAPRLIAPGQHTAKALAGSTLSLIVTGAGSSAPSAKLGEMPLTFANIDTGSYRTHHRLDHTTTLVIGPFWHRIARYKIDVITPIPPEIEFSALPAPDPDGKRVDLSWYGTSRYGLSGLALRMTPVGTSGAIPDEARLPARRRSGDDIRGTAKLNLLASPFAGMKVNGILAATNRNGQTGTSAPAVFTLPAPALHNATAQALEALRQELALNRTPRPELAERLKALGADPPGRITKDTRNAIAKFADGFGPQKPNHERAEAALWTLVQRAELGAAYHSAQQLAVARQALEHAMEKALAGHPPSRRQLDQLLAQLDHALQKHLAAQMPNGSPDTTRQKMRMSEIDRLTRQIEREAARGETEQARHDMERLRRMLGQLQNARPESAAQRAQQQAARQAGQHLSQIMRREADLMDRTTRNNRIPPLGNRAMQKPDKTGQALANEQQTLQQKLEATAQAMQAEGLKGLPQLGQGKKAMAGAHAHLARGDMAGAIPAERAAIHALQQAQNALQSMRSGQGTSGGPSGLGQQAAGGQGEYGNQSLSTVNLGRAGSRSDARRIQDELIRRDAKSDLPPAAHQYYGRLLGDGF